MAKKPLGSTEKKTGDKKGKAKDDGEEKQTKVSYYKSLYHALNEHMGFE
jgi:hypothetical protein